MSEDDDNIDYREKGKGKRERGKGYSELEWTTKRETQRQVEMEIQSQIHEVFRQIGYDIKEYKELRRLNEDLRFLSSLRESSQEKKSTILKGLITSCIGALIGLVTGLMTWFFTHK